MQLGKKSVAVLAAALLITAALPVHAVTVVPGTTVKVLAREMHMPMGIAVDNSGKIYVAAYGDSQIGRLKNKKSEVFAGEKSPRNLYNQSMGGYMDGDVSHAAFSQPTALLAYDGGLLVADTGNHLIRFIKNGAVYTYAGQNKAGYQNGTRQSAQFSMPSGLAADPQGNVYVADTGNQVIRRIDKDGTVTTVAGVANRAGFSDGMATGALLCDPMGMAWSGDALYIADSGNQRIRMLKNGQLTTVAGGGTQKYPGTSYYLGGHVNGAALSARFNNPQNIITDAQGNLYIADTDNGMIRVLSNGGVSTLLGGADTVVEKYLAEPYGLLLQGENLLISDRFTNYVISVAVTK